MSSTLANQRHFTQTQRKQERETWNQCVQHAIASKQKFYIQYYHSLFLDLNYSTKSGWATTWHVWSHRNSKFGSRPLEMCRISYENLFSRLDRLIWTENLVENWVSLVDFLIQKNLNSIPEKLSPQPVRPGVRGKVSIAMKRRMASRCTIVSLWS